MYQRIEITKIYFVFIYLGKCHILTFLSNVAITFLKVTGLPSTVFGYVELSIWTSHPRFVIEFAMCCFKMSFNHSIYIYLKCKSKIFCIWQKNMTFPLDIYQRTSLTVLLPFVSGTRSIRIFLKWKSKLSISSMSIA